MAVLRIQGFSGIVPVRGDRAIPDAFATTAVNTWLYGGELRGLRPPVELLGIQPSTRRVFRIPKRTVGGDPDHPTVVPPPSYLGDSVWVQFTDHDTDVVKGQLVEDQYERYYFCSPSLGPIFNTYDRLRQGLAMFKLGVPFVNTAAPTIPSPPAGTPTETRVYVYTWVNEFGEESAPSEPSIATAGAASGSTWNIANILDPAGYTAPPPFYGGVFGGTPYTYAGYKKKFLYRTVTGESGQTTYYRVTPIDGIAPGTTTFADNVSNTDLVNMLTLESTSWDPPPNQLPLEVSSITKATNAIVIVPNIGDYKNGDKVVIAGAVDSWAVVNGTWPISSVGTPSNSFTIPVNTTACVGSIMVDGVTAVPESAQCLRGMIAMPNGFLIGFDDNNIYMSEAYHFHAWPPEYQYATETPIVGLGVLGTTCVVCTQGYPATITGAKPATCSFTKATTGEPCLARGSIVSTPQGIIYASQNGLILVGPGGISNVTEQLITRDEWIKDYAPQFLRAVRYQNGYLAMRMPPLPSPRSGFFLDPTDLKVALTELSDFETCVALNVDFWSGEVFFIESGMIHRWDPPTDALMPVQWKSKEFQYGFQENFGAYAIYWDDARYSNADWGLGVMPRTEKVRFRVLADRRVVYDELVPRNGRPVRLPSGFKADIWQFEVLARAPVYSVHVASTVKELRNV